MGLPKVDARTIFSDMHPSDHPYAQTFRDHPDFGIPLTMSVMIKRKYGDIFNEERLQQVWGLTRDIDLAPAVDHDQVLSITTSKARYAGAASDENHDVHLAGELVLMAPRPLAHR